MPTKPSDDAVEWAYRRYVKGDSEQEAYFDELEVQMGIAQQIYDIRKKLGMTREDLAELAGFPAGTVRALEETYYDGDWETAIEKINAAFAQRVTEVVASKYGNEPPTDYQVLPSAVND